jgi:hypothetical protein
MGILMFRNDAASGSAGAPEESTFSLYHYDPTTAGAMVFLLLFLGTSLFHSWQLIRSRAWFVAPLVVGGFRKSQFKHNSESLLTVYQSRSLDMAVDSPLAKRQPRTGR